MSRPIPFALFICSAIWGVMACSDSGPSSPATLPPLPTAGGTDAPGDASLADAAADGSTASGSLDLPRTSLGRGPTDTRTPEPDATEPGCKFGNIVGTVCAIKDESEQWCDRIWVDATDCDGRSLHIEPVYQPDGSFTLLGVPAGAQSVFVQVGPGTLHCALLVDDEKVNSLNPDLCICEEGTCDGLFDERCEAKVMGDVCNCEDDDCDGEVDEDCVDSCNCTDDDCDGETDEDCDDLCDGVDNDCDDVIDEDCPLNSCTNPPTPIVDCDGNNVHDACPVCPPLEVVFAVDTSGSMNDEIDALCTYMDLAIAALLNAGIETSASVYMLDFPVYCGSGTLAAAFGKTAQSAPPEIGLMGAECLFWEGSKYTGEEWGIATAIIAANKNWAPGALRVVIPMSDEGPMCGDPVLLNDKVLIEAVSAFVASLNVRVYPITGSGASGQVIALAQDLAAATGGTSLQTVDPDSELIEQIIIAVFEACSSANDCNKNEIPDSCDLTAGTSTDLNGDGVLDECKF